MNYKLSCITCKKEFEPKEVLYTCPHCGDRLGTLEVKYDFSKVKINKNDFEKNASIWQFEKMLPVERTSYKTHLHIGGTPLYKFKNYDGLKNLYIKFEGGNPTASFKDRASAIAVTKAFEHGNDTIYCASTGNAASSLAGIAAPSGLKTYIFLPASAPKAKISQLFAYGANVLPIEGSYDQAFDISLEVGKKMGWYCRNSAINPYLLEGKKTCALEIAVQSEWKLPDLVLVSVGDGTVISSFYKGFSDLKQLGLIDRIPQIIGVQAKGSNSVKMTFEKGEPYKPCDIISNTVADSISVGSPRDVIKACKYVAQSGGYFVEVDDIDIINSIKEMACRTGIFGEPAGATAYAGLKKLLRDGKLDNSTNVCIVVTGSGLKDIKAVEGFVNSETVAPNIDKVLERISTLK